MAKTASKKKTSSKYTGTKKFKPWKKRTTAEKAKGILGVPGVIDDEMGKMHKERIGMKGKKMSRTSLRASRAGKALLDSAFAPTRVAYNAALLPVSAARDAADYAGKKYKAYKKSKKKK